MQLKSAVAFLVGASSVLAAPSEKSVPQGSPRFGYPPLTINPAFTLIGQEQAGNYTRLFFGVPNGFEIARREESSLSRRGCATQAIKCDNNNQAKTDLCSQLISDLYSTDYIKFSDNARSYCILGDKSDNNPYCCVSWSQSINGLTKADLKDVASSIKSTCGDGGVSGKVYYQPVKNTCLNVCVSNRGTDCG